MRTFYYLFLFSLLISFGPVWACLVEDLEVRYFNQDGISDWDRTSDQLITTFPEIKNFSTNLPDNLKVKIDYSIASNDCLSQQEDLSLQIKIFPYSAPYRMKGGDENHDQHDQIPHGTWNQEPIYTYTKKLSNDISSPIEAEDIEFKKIWQKVPDYMWFWKFRLELEITQNEKILISNETIIESRLTH